MKTTKQQFIDGIGWGIVTASLLGSFLIVIELMKLGVL